MSILNRAIDRSLQALLFCMFTSFSDESGHRFCLQIAMDVWHIFTAINMVTKLPIKQNSSNKKKKKKFDDMNCYEFWSSKVDEIKA